MAGRRPWSRNREGEDPVTPIRLTLKKNLTVDKSKTEIGAHFVIGGDASFPNGSDVAITVLDLNGEFTKTDASRVGTASTEASGYTHGGLNSALLVNLQRPRGVASANTGGPGMIKTYEAQADFQYTERSLNLKLGAAVARIEATAKNGGFSGGVLDTGIKVSSNSSTLIEAVKINLDCTSKNGTVSAGEGTFTQLLP